MPCTSNVSQGHPLHNIFLPGQSSEDPNIDYAKLAQSMGRYAEGPVTDPKELGHSIRRAVAVVENGEPALLDAVTQPI
jgi:acetolactate synthase I/II/III large subunit